jgi:hypothetical protein
VPWVQVAEKVSVVPTVVSDGTEQVGPVGPPPPVVLQVIVMLLPVTTGPESDWQPTSVMDCAEATPAVPNADASNNAAQPKRVRKRDVMVFSRITS